MAASPPKIKICCIGSLEEASLAVEAGASALGLVSEMPSGPGVISESKIREISLAFSHRVETFLLTARTNPAAIAEQHRRCRTTTIQLVDCVVERDLEAIRRELQGVRLVQVVHVQGENAIRDAIRLSGYVDALLLDSGNTALQTKELGGTGRVHNWAISTEIVKSVSVPVYLAGGVGVGNVREAIRAVNPYGLDLCSSIRTNDQLDRGKLREFMHAVAA